MRLAPFGPNSLFMISVLALAVALIVYQWLHNRSETEKLFRYYVDQAQLSALNGHDNKAVSAWRDAIENAIALGDNPKLIGNLYLEKAKSEIAASKALTKPTEVETSRQQIIGDIQRALTHYQKDSFTTLAQIQAQELLLSILPVYTERFVSDEEQVRIDERRATAEKLLKEGKQSEALKVFTEVVIASKGLTRAALEDDIKQLMTRRSNPRTNAEELFPITSALFTYQICASAQTTVEEGQSLNLLLDQALKASGHAKDDYQYLKKLGDRMFVKANYHGANLAYWRCQALKDSAEVREHLKFCYLKLHPTKTEDSQAAISAVVELIRLNVKAFGQDSKQVTGAVERHAELLESTGNFEEAETRRRTVFDRIVADKSGQPFYDRYGQIISDPARQAEDAIMKLYVTEGKFKEALAWYRERQPQSDQMTEMDFTFVDLCTKANWLSDPMLEEVIERERHD
ncbi:MAG: hypothetical protein EKK48_21625 [Candidatus Melainabacteria bacterium]|nr:MAG: hypothetical protein EKK48_21625 [Candidatus Melainabacteria bacterium]